MRFRLLIPAVAIAVLVFCATAFALLTYQPTGLKTAKVTVGKTKQNIVVDTRGVTVYELSGESANANNLECQSRTCLKVWLALKVRGYSSPLKLAKGVPGKSSVFRRVKAGFYQATLAGHPLYYYSGDNGRAGLTKGNGLVFGKSKKTGKNLVWHVVKAS
jgi:predicted lipoprotein with Yx(FWY)xxD motif